jgi:hypothetical protein
LVTVALLTVGDAGRSFQLLVVTSSCPRPSMSLRTQIYSKDDGRWGPVTEITDLPRELELTRCAPSRRPEALVLGGGTTVHWLHNYSGWCIVRLDIDEAKSTLITLPPECVHQSVDELQLAASTDGKLSLVVAEYCVISMWTLSAATPGEGASARWTRQVVIRREGISRAPTGRYKNHRDLFLGFGELSSTVVLLMHHIGLVRINLRTKEALVLGSDDEFKEIEAAHDGFNKIEACLHEIDLPSILLAMKPY